MAKKSDLKEITYLEIEKSRINREKSRIVLNKSLSLYVVFMIVGVIGFVFDFIDSTMLNTLIIAGIVILVLGTLPYLLISHKEEKKIDGFIKKLKK